MAVRRTTLAAEADDLARLEQEALRRGISLAALLREVVAAAASALRAERAPRFGVGHSAGHDRAVDIPRHDEEPYEAHPFRG